MFISIEGPDGAGKSTQARLLAQDLQDSGYDVLLAREPGGSPIGDQIREVLTSLENTAMNARTEYLLFSASRAQLVQQVIQPQLARGGLVVCDRYADSSLAYQGYGHGLSLEALRFINRFATAGLYPDLTLLLDLPPDMGLDRRKEGGSWNRLDDYQEEFHRRVRRGYLNLAKEEPDRWVILDATRSIEGVHEEIKSILRARLMKESL